MCPCDGHCRFALGMWPPIPSLSFPFCLSKTCFPTALQLIAHKCLHSANTSLLRLWLIPLLGAEAFAAEGGGGGGGALLRGCRPRGALGAQSAPGRVHLAAVNPDAHVAPQVTMFLRFEVLGLCSAAWRKTQDASMMQCAWCARCTGGTLSGSGVLLPYGSKDCPARALPAFCQGPYRACNFSDLVRNFPCNFRNHNYRNPYLSMAKGLTPSSLFWVQSDPTRSLCCLSGQPRPPSLYMAHEVAPAGGLDV